MQNKKSQIALYIISSVSAVLTVIILTQMGSNTIDVLTKQDKDSTIIQTAIIADTTSNVLPTPKVNSVLDELLKQKQELEARFFEEVSGKTSGKAGVGANAKKIQKEIEEIQLQIDVIQKAMGIETKAQDDTIVHKDTTQN